MKFYQIQDREAGNIIETNLTLDEAIVQVARFELSDRKDFCYVPDFYQIKEMEE